MNSYKKENYEIGSSYAVELEQRMREAGAWPDCELRSQKKLRRALRILRASDLADQNAYVSIINYKSEEMVRLRYWRDWAPRLCQDKGLFDWPTTELSIEEMTERLRAAGIDTEMIEDGLTKTIIKGKEKRKKIAERNERRERENLKIEKCRELLDVKYRQLLTRVENEHGLKLDYFLWHNGMQFRVRIYWRTVVPIGAICDSYFTVSRDFAEPQSSTEFPSTVNAMLQVKELSDAMIQKLQESECHLSMVNQKLTVMSGYRKRQPYFRRLYREEPTNKPVTAGEVVELAARLNEKINEVGLSLHL